MDIEHFITEVYQSMQNFQLDDLPGIDLYMDQVLSYLNDKLEISKRHEEDKLLTKTMINNYVKIQLLPPPEKKKYSKDHLLALILIFLFKNVVSMNDVDLILNPLMSDSFNSKDDSLEHAVHIFLEHVQSEKMMKPILKEYEESQKMVKRLTDSPNKDLEILSFISILSYDMFLRKLIIEKLVDSLPKPEKKAEEKAEKEKAEKAKKKEKKQNREKQES